MVQPLWRTVWQAFKGLSIELPYNPEISFVGTYIFKKVNNICPLKNQ